MRASARSASSFEVYPLVALLSFLLLAAAHWAKQGGLLALQYLFLAAAVIAFTPMMIYRAREKTDSWRAAAKQVVGTCVVRRRATRERLGHFVAAGGIDARALAKALDAERRTAPTI